MKKLSLSLLTLTLCSQAMASELVCTIMETLNGTATKVTEVRPALNAGSHAFTNWSNNFGDGFIAVSGGNVVVQISTKADERSFSFFGPYVKDGIVNGSTCLADASTCLQITCK